MELDNQSFGSNPKSACGGKRTVPLTPKADDSDDYSECSSASVIGNTISSAHSDDNESEYEDKNDEDYKPVSPTTRENEAPIINNAQSLTPDQGTTPPVILNATKPRKKKRCELCWKLLTIKLYPSHVRRCNGVSRSQFKNVHCDYCNFIFYDKEAKNKHLFKKHTGK